MEYTTSDVYLDLDSGLQYYFDKNGKKIFIFPQDRQLTEKQLENLKKAREAALLKKRELKELAQKAKALPKKEIEVKAAEYDKLEEKKKQILEAPKAIKKTTKKVIEVEEEEEETKPVKKVTVNNSLEENVSMLSIQQKLKLERQKMLMSALTPMC